MLITEASTFEGKSFHPACESFNVIGDDVMQVNDRNNSSSKVQITEASTFEGKSFHLTCESVNEIDDNVMQVNGHNTTSLKCK